MKTRYFISHHCRYIKGAHGSAIYDLKNNLVYNLNNDASVILDQALAGEVSQDEEEFLDKLSENELLNVFGKNIDYEYEVTPQIKYVWLELTGRCNCNCLHCYGQFGTPETSTLNEELSVQEWKDVLNSIKHYGGNAIQLIGGEPLLYPGFTEILIYAKHIGINSIDIFTNAYFLNEEYVKIIKNVGASVRVSLYGYDSASHDIITQNKGSFSALDYSLRLLSDAGIPTRIAVVLMRENQDWLDKIIEYIKSTGHKYTGYDTVRTVATCDQNCNSVTNETILKNRYMERAGFHASKETYNTYKQWNSCWFGKFAITSGGNIIPCIFARDLICGNIRTDSLDCIREKLFYYWKITKDKVDTCKQCEYRYCCDDCRPLAMGIVKNLYDKYPRCCYLPEYGVWKNFHEYIMINNS